MTAEQNITAKQRISYIALHLDKKSSKSVAEKALNDLINTLEDSDMDSSTFEVATLYSYFLPARARILSDKDYMDDFKWVSQACSADDRGIEANIVHADGSYLLGQNGIHKFLLKISDQLKKDYLAKASHCDICFKQKFIPDYLNAEKFDCTIDPDFKLLENDKYGYYYETVVGNNIIQVRADFVDQTRCGYSSCNLYTITQRNGINQVIITARDNRIAITSPLNEWRWAK